MKIIKQTVTRMLMEVGQCIFCINMITLINADVKIIIVDQPSREKLVHKAMIEVKDTCFSLCS